LKTYQQILIFSCLLLFAYSCSDSRTDAKLSQTRVSNLLAKAQDDSSDSSLKEKYVDSAYNELADKKNDTLTRFYYKKTVEAYYGLEQYDKSLLSSRKVYNLAQEVKDTLNMARALYNTADSYYAKANNDSAFYYYSQAEKLYDNLDDTGTLGEIILYKAYVYYNIGEYALCESEAFKALKFLINEDKTTHIYNCYNLIATSLEGQENNSEAIKYFQLALMQLDKFNQEEFTPSDINLYRASCYNNMGLVYEKMQKYDEAIKLYNEALQYNRIRQDSPALYAKLLNNLAYVKFKSGNHSQLPQLFFKSLSIRDSLQNISGIIASKIHLGEYYLYMNDTATAIDYFKDSYTQADKIDSHTDILKTLKFLSEVDKNNAAFYSNRYIKVNDSLQEVAKKNRNKFARIEYETDKLQGEKEELVKRNSFIIGVSAIVLLFIGAIFIIYYLNSRNKKLLLIQEQQKANEEIYQLMFKQQSKVQMAREEEKTRIAMELHDGILNNIYAVRLNLEFINKKADEESVAKRREYIKELQKVESEIRGVSHDLSRNVVFKDKNFKDLLESAIVSQKNTFDTNFEANVDASVDWDRMSNVQKVNIYRIIQECLQNINKYAQAKHARVDVKAEKNNIHVIITDDGVGFDADKVKGGIGLKNLRKRTSLLNGKINIDSATGEGSRIEVVFPN
jgi:signal transduction histidine kinase